MVIGKTKSVRMKFSIIPPRKPSKPADSLVIGDSKVIRQQDGSSATVGHPIHLF